MPVASVPSTPTSGAAAAPTPNCAAPIKAAAVPAAAPCRDKARAGAWADEHRRTPAAVTLLVTASGVTVVGLGAAPLGLLAGGALLLLDRARQPRQGAPSPAPASQASH